jgi:hypothetical protein
MGNTLASFIWSIRNSPLAISKAAIHKQLSRDLEFRKQYQFAREFGADMICGQIIATVDSSTNRGFKRPSLAIIKNWWPKNKSKKRESLIQVIRLLDLAHSARKSCSDRLRRLHCSFSY